MEDKTKKLNKIKLLIEEHEKNEQEISKLLNRQKEIITSNGYYLEARAVSDIGWSEEDKKEFSRLEEKIKELYIVKQNILNEVLDIIDGNFCVKGKEE